MNMLHNQQYFTRNKKTDIIENTESIDQLYQQSFINEWLSYFLLSIYLSISIFYNPNPNIFNYDRHGQEQCHKEHVNQAWVKLDPPGIPLPLALILSYKYSLASLNILLSKNPMFLNQLTAAVCLGPYPLTLCDHLGCATLGGLRNWMQTFSSPT